MFKKIFLSTLFLLSFAASANDIADIDETSEQIVAYFAGGGTLVEADEKPLIYRKILKNYPDGSHLIQDFYIKDSYVMDLLRVCKEDLSSTHEIKYTDPYRVNNVSLQILDIVPNEGAKIQWDARGFKSGIVHYHNGKKHGVETSWHSKEQKKEELNYINGKREGTHIV
ncbi:toxin-antitoxin system YwqK family antitoxin [Neisseria sp. Ec49-e6-T10]|uniref:toxin-antitoxin system YwqK family antitoxin n=1 Tax=Neisseria sp. Ec49-e6-T10 TaxID=3140744 RepID=UPI003EC11630